MGCGASVEPARVRVGLGDVMRARYPKSLVLLDLAGRADDLAALFAITDRNHTGALSLLEFLDACDLERTALVTRIFGLIDSDGSGELDFRELLFLIYQVRRRPAGWLAGCLPGWPRRLARAGTALGGAASCGAQLVCRLAAARRGDA